MVREALELDLPLGQLSHQVDQSLRRQRAAEYISTFVSHDCIAALTESGRSRGAMWPHSSRSTRSAPGMHSAISSLNSGGAIWSWRPQTIRAGQKITASNSRLSALPIAACCWRTNPALPIVFAMEMSNSVSGLSLTFEGCTTRGRNAVATEEKSAAPLPTPSIIRWRIALAWSESGRAPVSTIAMPMTRSGACRKTSRATSAPVLAALTEGLDRTYRAVEAHLPSCSSRRPGGRGAFGRVDQLLRQPGGGRGSGDDGDEFPRCLQIDPAS